MGREIAQGMGYQAASWLDRPEREKEEHCSKLLEGLKLKPGDVVADVGAGSGYYTFRMAGRVGDKGKVLAVDIQQEMLDLINKRKAEKELKNVETVLGTLTDPNLPPDTAHPILLAHLTHEFSPPSATTAELV